MKKIVIYSLGALAVLTLGLMLAGCGAKKYTSIPLGGDLPDYELDAAFGESYTEFDVDEEYHFEVDDVKGYECKDSDTPYILVYRWARDGQTLEESMDESVASGEMDDYYITEYQPQDYGTIGYYTCSLTFQDGNYYYLDAIRIVDGDDFVEVCCLAATEELILGETGLAAYIPKGYKDVSSTDPGADKVLTYEDYYYIPNIWVWNHSTKDYTYADFKEAYAATYEGVEFPISEEQWNSYIKKAEEGWSLDDFVGYYQLLGFDYVSTTKITTNDITINWDKVKYVLGGQDGAADALYIYYNDQISEIWLNSTLNPFPEYGHAFIDSIHAIK